MPGDKILVRVQSPNHGTKRIEAGRSQKVEEFLINVRREFNLPVNGWKLYLNKERSNELKYTRTATLQSKNISHGDMLFLSLPLDSVVESSGVSSTESRDSSRSVIEDEVDQLLWKQDGKIERERNDQLCRHGPTNKCLHCVPLEPYDEEFLAKADPPIKFLSFHSYLRKLTGGVNKGKFAMLENISCRIKPGCKEHLPWPNGICTKCQPNAVTLQRQKYRHVDYIQFENPSLMEHFLDYWRKTGNQRIGLLYGRYECHKDVPLGIKAVVSAIYEPKQMTTKQSIELIEEEPDSVKQTMAQLQLVKVGWIFTDLVPLQSGLVKHFRGHADSHFISAEECIMAAGFQSRNPNPCRLSPDGHFGSKFVTVVVTGDEQNQIHFEGYQVSNQCMALAADDCLVPTKDVPELGYIRESTNEQYVPDVFYKDKDEYGNEITQLARPLPVEYLLVEMPAAFPVEPTFTFKALSTFGNSFPIENRTELGESQDFNSWCRYIRQFSPDQYLTAFSDFHVLSFMSVCDIFTPLQNWLRQLVNAVRDNDISASQILFNSEEWRTIEQLSTGVAESESTGTDIAATSQHWQCQHCTFLNPLPNQSCEICALPRN